MIDLPALTEATWPPAAKHAVGPWIVREGQGAGQRVSATSASGVWAGADIPQAEAAMRALGQSPIFVIWPDDAALDAALAARGYRINDPVVAYAAPTAALADPAPPFLTTFPHWPPLGIATALWFESGLNPARLAVMERVAVPKCVILGRNGDRAAGVAFVALHGKTAMLHALEVAPAYRRQGTAHNILRAAALWAQDHGADTLALLVTEANAGARALYASLNMSVVGHYHYRKL
ncbi:GNAT family N-acetyltransferase [Paragemmobacter straminiformis]|uniref:GNAT family N-acetyltransferase n=1 Tax=Paragemmobacter straminiformis TaxID=2045119 RepID=A0A842I493_9RHOB|nr:GNAT family N-acetyltransferase [Gemmobacter straminiformis]MBC2834476.1 GNAT family N-acetyltransferase [Gemmobacter straminiformis]